VLDRLESISRVLCIGLGALLALQLVNAIMHGDPLGRATIPDLPTLPADASSASVQTNTAPGSNSVTSVKTNSLPATNTVASVKTNSGSVANTNAVAKTNATLVAEAAAPVKTNAAPVASATTSEKTNAAPGVDGKTNSVAGAKPARPRLGGPLGMQNKKIDLPPAVQARVDRVVESEILGPFIRPMPMALLGIAGEDAFLRASDGQTGMVKEGAELGAVKLLRIGTNRVLVEENGEKKELTLFAGMGGDSLLPPETNSTVKTNVPMKKKEAQ
jgi:hypothetical protein